MTHTPQKQFDVGSGESDVLYFNGHPAYDALRVDFDGANSVSTSVDVEFAVETENELDVVKAGGFSVMDATEIDAGLDASAGVTTGTESLGRTVAVRVTEVGGVSGAEGTITLHSASDPAVNASAFLNR